MHLLSLCLALAAAQQQPAPSDSSVRAMLGARLGTEGATAIVAGLLAPDGSRRVIAAGPADGNTVFEIGSITKVFTGVLLARMAADGEVRLDEPVGALLGDSVAVPSRNGRAITLVDLATHSSGLPRLPANLAPRTMANPYADYTADQLYRFLAGYTLPRDVGRYEYSNLGMGLLGYALAHRAGTSYEEALVSRVLRPLGLADTRISLSDDLRRRLTPGHDALGEVVPNWDLPTLAGAGALRSTANDLLAFLAANLDTTRGPLGPALAEAQRARLPASPTLTVGLGWHVIAPRGDTVTWHNGGTGGYHSFIGFIRSRKTAVVVLANSRGDVDDIGLHLLDGRAPLRAPRALPPVVTLAPEVLDRYVGTYVLTPTFQLTVTREGAHLYVQATGQQRLRLHARAVGEFFIREVEASLSFVSEGGRVAAVILHQGGRDQRAARQP